MKNIIYITFVTGLIFASNFNINAKGFMPSLDRLKNKVDNAIKGPKTTLKDFLEKTKNVGSKIFINGRSVEELNAQAERKSFETEISEIEKDLSDLYWSNQDKFAEFLKQAQDKTTVLKEKFKEKYPNVKAPLITFAKELSQENDKLNQLQDKIKKSIESVKKYSDLALKYQNLAEISAKLNTILTEIITATDSL